jgi:hypothetical protein
MAKANVKNKEGANEEIPLEDIEREKSPEEERVELRTRVIAQLQMAYYRAEEDFGLITSLLDDFDRGYATEAWEKVHNFLSQKENEVMSVMGVGSALWIASFNGHTDVVKLLIEYHANVNSTGSNGTTALWSAARNGHTDIVKLLIQNNANVNKKDNVFTAPIWLAAPKTAYRYCQATYRKQGRDKSFFRIKKNDTSCGGFREWTL